jgi:hypothetical protein
MSNYHIQGDFSDKNCDLVSYINCILGGIILFSKCTALPQQGMGTDQDRNRENIDMSFPGTWTRKNTIFLFRSLDYTSEMFTSRDSGV